MKVTEYHKLVRDLIPGIIEADGKRAVMEILPEDRYVELLEKKLEEELGEYLQSKELEELADLLEVIYALSAAKGSSPSSLEALRKKKAAERGGFHDRILLREVIGG